MLQCQTTGVIVRTSACLNMNMCDLYGSKVSAVQVQTCHGAIRVLSLLLLVAVCVVITVKTVRLVVDPSSTAAVEHLAAKVSFFFNFFNVTLNVVVMFLGFACRGLVWRSTPAAFAIWLVTASITVRTGSSSR